MRLGRGKRAVVYMIPRKDHLLASFALGEKVCAAAREAGLPASVPSMRAEAPKYAEGRGVRIPVRTDASAIPKLSLSFP
jgi:hypothetical protein